MDIPTTRVARWTLPLSAACGRTAAEIARAFLVSEPAMAQHSSRAKRRIAASVSGYTVSSTRWMTWSW